jgi:hypothetical protein
MYNFQSHFWKAINSVTNVFNILNRQRILQKHKIKMFDELTVINDYNYL